ncbi:hypothetical protein [Mycobacterium sp. pR1184]|uniref:hypothetical protein n=1 Tax=Mycobacterium sp. pR1184 TaxID=3238981 RepID=UPI00351BE00D
MGAGWYQLPAGTYRELVVNNRRMLSAMDVFPMMGELLEKRRSSTEDDVEVERLRLAIPQAMKQAKVKAADLIDEALAAGEPIVALASQVQVAARHHADQLADAPSWLSSETATMRVFADDSCEPASY